MQMKNYIKTILITVIYIAILLIFVQCNNTVNIDKQASHKPIIPPKPRLQIDIAKGSSDLQWWRDAKTTREQRLEGWRDARFGCFIHWNASALLGSSWKGKGKKEKRKSKASTISWGFFCHWAVP